MASFNRIIMMGNLTRDPEAKQLSSGQSVCRLGLACNRQFKNKQTGTMVQEVCFVDIDVWGAQAESCNQYLQKGSGILVEGRLKLDTWQDNEGQKRSKHSIVADRVTFLPSANSVKSDDFSQTKQDNSQSVGNEQKAAFNNLVSEQKMEAKQDSSSGEVAFKDKAPFEDDLPF